VFAWGFNGHFELGLGEGTHRNSPQLVLALEARNVTTLTAGGYHAMAVTGSGGLFTWGACRLTRLTRSKPVALMLRAVHDNVRPHPRTRIMIRPNPERTHVVSG
jgi:alpha-tubulin suppressor-like RCC1 family protein